MADFLKVDGGILAGGLSRRMGGIDKGLHPFLNQPMVSWIYQTLKPFVNKVIINCNRNAEVYRQFSSNIVADTLPNFPGPLAGIVSLMTVSDADYLLISPCDTPSLGSDFPKRMLNELASYLEKNPDIPYLLAVKTSEHHHPLHLCISIKFKQSLLDYLNQGNHRVMNWMEQNKVIWIDFSDQNDSFKNINSINEVSTN